MTTAKSNRPAPRSPKGFRDSFAAEVIARRRMVETIREVYERYGFEPLETAAFEYVDVLGKFLPEQDGPAGGIFALTDDDDQWMALRYDLTAPLSRVVAQYAQNLPRPYRRYQYGPVWRDEKPGPGRFREFFQFDVDTVGSASMAADAEICTILSESMEALGIPRGDYVVKVNNRKILNGVLEAIGIPADESGGIAGQRLGVLRAIDKLDRVAVDGVRELLQAGRRDESGDFTAGAGLDDRAAETVLAFVQAGAGDRTEVCDKLADLVGASAVGAEGIDELRQIHDLLAATGHGPDRVVFEPAIVRGLAYYTGPVYEVVLTFDVTDEQGRRRQVGSVAGGGRYDDLVKRFTGTDVPATGVSIGVDRLLAALRAVDKAGPAKRLGPVVVTILDRERLLDYQRMAQELRAGGIAAELYLGSSGLRAQMKYADRRAAPVCVIAGGDEFERGEVQLKDLRLGDKLAQEITDRDEWRKGQPAQVSVPRDQLVERTRAMLREGGE